MRNRSAKFRAYLQNLESRVLLANDLAENLIDQGVAAHAAAMNEMVTSAPILSGSLIISEFMAVNGDSLQTQVRPTAQSEYTGGVISPDWIELSNTSSEILDLSGMYLTDSAANVRKWQIPVGTVVQPHGYLLVFTSGLDISDPNLDKLGINHTSFKLSGGGEYLGLADSDGTIISEYASELPDQFEDVSFGVSSDSDFPGYFTTPTPGTSNGSKMPLDSLFADVTHDFVAPGGVQTRPLVSTSSISHYLIPDEDTGPSLGKRWTTPDYTLGALGESWLQGHGTHGFGVRDETTDAFDTDLAAVMQDTNASALLRYNFDVPDPKDLTGLKLRLHFDDGFVAYLNGHRVASEHAGIGVHQPDDPVALFRFDETSGNTVEEATGQWPNAILRGFAHDNSHWVPGQIGGGIVMDGVDDWLSARTPIADGTDAITFSGWVWSAASTRWSSIVKNWGPNVTGQFYLGLQHKSELTNLLTDNVKLWETGKPPFPTGSWQHLAFSYDGQQHQLYRNGQLVGTRHTRTPLNQNSTMLGIGAMPNNDGTGPARFRAGYWDGMFDDFAFWDRALDAEAIEFIYQRGLSGQGVPYGETGGPVWNSGATLSPTATVTKQQFDLTEYIDLLQPTNNVLAIHGLNAAADDDDFLVVVELDGEMGSDTLPSLRVQAGLSPEAEDIDDVMLHYHAMFGEERILAMTDDGKGADIRENDGVFTATIPGGIAQPNEMIRYYVAAAGADEREFRAPAFLDRVGVNQSPEYFGTVIPDRDFNSPLPVIHRFIRDTSLAETREGTRASIFHDGEFYDNVFIRNRGSSTSAAPKKGYKVEFNNNHFFRFDPALPRRVDEINLNTTMGDPAYIRPVLAAETHRDVGGISPIHIPVRVQQNGAFFSVAILVEQPDEEYLVRSGLDPNGFLFKGVFRLLQKTRIHEDRSELDAFLEGLKKTGADLDQFLFDNINVPAQINFMVALTLSQNTDVSGKNFHYYQDTDGTGEWFMSPWDQDLSFDAETMVHPFYLTGEDPLGRSSFVNPLIDAMIVNPRTREMYLRRLRTMADKLLATSYYSNRIDELVEMLRADVLLDRAAWGSRVNNAPELSLEQANDRVKDYVQQRLVDLTDYHVRMGAGIPLAQIESPSLEFGQIEHAPTSQNENEEFVELVNPNATSVDISQWRLTGAGIEHAFRPGTVLEAKGRLYVSPDVPTFRSRSESPGGNQRLFVQGEYQGRLSNNGGTLTLSDDRGQTIAEVTVQGSGVPPSQALRVSEIHYHPADPTETERHAGHSDGDDFEFIEIVNISDQSIDLHGVRLVKKFVDDTEQGVEFDLATGVISNLSPGARIVIVENENAFRFRYGEHVPVAGQWSGGLGNNTEQITLVANDQILQQFSYDDGWYPSTDGGGSSLEINDASNGLSSWNSKNSWRPSSKLGGTPGIVAIRGDLNNDQLIDLIDIELLQAELRSGTSDAGFDFTGDGLVDLFDLAELVESIIGARFGDTDLNGTVDSADFAVLAGRFGSQDATWSTGDTDGDGDVDFTDFNRLANNFG